MCPGLLIVLCVCRRDPDAWTFKDGRPCYVKSAPVPADAELSALLVEACRGQLGQRRVVEGLDATADSFYSSQVGGIV
jgi:hypothetical protein